ncbi:MAG: Endonuclease [Rickettsiaceae bacterium]|jgi:endonuclease-3|nr:Endonuclease [Rickettsiaceae bacterium]
MKPVEINAIFQEFYNRDPDPKTELQYTNNYTLLVAVALSAQATDISVNKATKDLFQKYDTPEKMLVLGEEGLAQYIKSIGLYRTKARNIIALSRILIEHYNSTVPDSLDKLVKLPGVGRKTANVVLNCAFKKDCMPVDTHVFRVAKRLGLSKGRTPEAVEQDLLAIIPKKWLYGAHHWLILHGRYTCIARKPKCEECIISKYCQYYKENKIGYV